MYLLSQILDRAAEAAPDREAFRCEGKSLTYGELLLRANGLAEWLVAHGVNRGDRIGIYLSKSLESAIAIYGIWKAGGAYVPLDTAAPIARSAYALTHCGVRHLITHPSKRRKLSALLVAAPEVQWIVGAPEGLSLDDAKTDDAKTANATGRKLTCCDWADLPMAAIAPNVTLVAQDLAYIMYTSGSTGTPKGIMHTHYSGLSYAQLVASTYGLTSSDRIGNHSPLHFDISTLGFFAGPLVTATTVIIPEAYTKVPASLSQLIEDEALTIWYSVPLALTQLWLRGILSERDLTALRWVLFAGEPWAAKYLHAMRQQLPHAWFSNIYGPAEVNQCMYYHLPPFEEEETQPENITPIGQVWANSEALVVDENNHPVASGDIGELLIRTATMMSGYWQRPDLSATAFFHTHVANQPAIFYRTGDLVIQQPDNQYRFVGRKDRQIKTRGYRVELDEVEAALVSHPQVEEAATYAIMADTGSYNIAAAVIVKPDANSQDTIDQPAIAATLKRYAAKRLPSYALPQQIVVLQAFPRTGTGKIDRRALQEKAMVPS